MLPVVTVEEMRAIDAAAAEPVEVLIDRAGRAVARTAIAVLGGTYGRRVCVLVGPGNNGADGRVAAAVLARRGVRVAVRELGSVPDRLPPVDLVIDALLGTGASRPLTAPDTGGTPVLAVDIPSGVDGDTGQVLGSAMPAAATVTFAAHKPGLLLGPGAALAGDVHVVDIGLPTDSARIELVTDAGVAGLLPERDRRAHKWSSSVFVVAGSPGMTGAASLAAEAALRSGAGLVQLATPGVPHSVDVAREVVTVDVPDAAWLDVVVPRTDRAHALAIGPGLGTSMVARHQIRSLLTAVPLPAVVDGDGITALGGDAGELIGGRSAPVVLTPHDGEFERLAGRRPSADRIADVRALAESTSAVVLAKGSPTVIADPGGRVRIVDAGDQRLATAGTGDVLTGVVAALLAAGLDAFDAAAAAAHVHGRAGGLGAGRGVIASDVLAALGPALETVAAAGVRS